MKIAIVCDWLYGGGAEKVVLELHRMYPDAPIYTSYCSDEWRKKLDDNVVVGYLQWWPFAKARKFLPLLRQWWFRSLNLTKFDLVISCTGNGEAKFIRTRTDAKHVCYCFTPPHFYWKKYHEYLQNPGFGSLNILARFGLKTLVSPLRKRDFAAAQRVDQFISISSHIQHDIKHCYGRDSTVVYPPVDAERFVDMDYHAPKQVGFITWGRHVPYKRFDLAIAACNELGLPLTVIGTGPETTKLKSIAGPTITFTGFASEQIIIDLARKSSAFLFPSEEDFGIAPVEAMALGLPVIAYKSGGALDYVIPGKTGEFFENQTVANIVEVLQNFKPRTYHTKDIRHKAEQFSAQNFRTNLQKCIERSTD